MEWVLKISLNSIWTGLFCLCISGCITVPVSEKNVFAPISHDNYSPARSAQDIKILGTEVFGIRQSGIITDNRKVDVYIDDKGEITNIENGLLNNDGTITGYSYFNKPGKRRPLILMCMGNGSDRYSAAVKYARRRIKFGNIIVFDYPGYGDSNRVASIDSLRDMYANLNNLIKKKSRESEFFVAWGHSLGGFLCSELATKSTIIDMVIVENSARNVDEVMKSILPWYIKSVVNLKVAESLREYDNFQALASFSGSILILAGSKDDVLPPELALSLYTSLKKVNSDVRYFEFENGGHTNSFEQPKFDKVVSDFLRRQH